MSVEPGERPVLTLRRRAVLDRHLDVAELERALAAAITGSRHRVGDESDTSGRARPDQPHGLVGQVVAVHDHSDHDAGAREGRAGDPRITGAEGTHGVEDVGDAADSEVEGVVGLARRRVRVPGRHRDPALAQALDERIRPGQLGRERHLGDCARVEQPVEQRDVGRAQVDERMRAGPVGRRGKVLRRCAPRIRGPEAPVGIARSASIVVSSAEVMNVGWYAVTPARSSASPAR